jgi:hypothetical protein
MAITKETKIDQVTIGEDGTIFLRYATVISEDGVELNKSFNRSTLDPGSSLDNLPINVVNICNAVWTPEVVNNFKAARDAEIARIESLRQS